MTQNEAKKYISALRVGYDLRVMEKAISELIKAADDLLAARAAGETECEAELIAWQAALANVEVAQNAVTAAQSVLVDFQIIASEKEMAYLNCLTSGEP